MMTKALKLVSDKLLLAACLAAPISKPRQTYVKMISKAQVKPKDTDVVTCEYDTQNYIIKTYKAIVMTWRNKLIITAHSKYNVAS